MLRYLASVVVVILIAGCVIGVSTERFSAPTIDNPAISTRHVAGVPVDKMFLLEDVAFYVYPANEQNDGTVLLIPPGIYKGVPTAWPTFQVGIGLRPNTGGFVIDPAQIRLIRASTEIILPTKVMGPHNCSDWSRREWVQFPIQPVVLHKSVCTRFGIEFAVPAPDPSEMFSIQVAGLTMDGETRTIPVVHFHERKSHDPVGVP